VAVHVHERAEHDAIVAVPSHDGGPVHAGSRAEVAQHGARLGGGGKRVRAGGDVVVGAVSAGGYGPELEERAAREARAEEGGEHGGVRDDVAAGQVVERLERVGQVVREADVEREQRVGEVAVREEARPRSAGVEAVAEERGQRAV
jgi:hypothetical protein